jgi:hypothetical protein
MSDDDIIKALEEAEDEVARIEAEIMRPPVVKSALSDFLPLSLASLSLQCRSISLMDLVNTSLITQNLPTTWAQNEARYTIAVPPTSTPTEGHTIAPIRTLRSGAALATSAPAVSNNWKRSLLSSAGVSKPLAFAWGEALSLRCSADSNGSTVAVPSDALRFLPLIDPQFEEYAALNTVFNLNLRDIQVPSCSRHKFFFTKPSYSADFVVGHAFCSEQQRLLRFTSGSIGRFGS